MRSLRSLVLPDTIIEEALTFMIFDVGEAMARRRQETAVSLSSAIVIVLLLIVSRFRFLLFAYGEVLVLSMTRSVGDGLIRSGWMLSPDKTTDTTLPSIESDPFSASNRITTPLHHMIPPSPRFNHCASSPRLLMRLHTPSATAALLAVGEQEIVSTKSRSIFNKSNSISVIKAKDLCGITNYPSPETSAVTHSSVFTDVDCRLSTRGNGPILILNSNSGGGSSRSENYPGAVTEKAFGEPSSPTLPKILTLCTAIGAPRSETCIAATALLFNSANVLGQKYNTILLGQACLWASPIGPGCKGCITSPI